MYQVKKTPFAVYDCLNVYSIYGIVILLYTNNISSFVPIQWTVNTMEKKFLL